MSEPAPGRTFSVVIIGCGNIAGGYDERTERRHSLTHAGAFLRHGKFDIAACVDPDERRREAFMRYWGIARGYSDLASCRAETQMKFDVASVCAPTDFHAAYLMELAADPVGLVFCEKPFTTDYASASAAVAAFDRAHKPLIVNYLRRWCPEIAQIADTLQSRRLGKTQTVTARYGKGLLHGGSHTLDLLQFFFGKLEAQRVLGFVDDAHHHDKTLHALLKTADDVPVFLIGADYRTYNLFEIDIVLSDGRIIIDDLGERCITYALQDSEEFPGHRILREESEKTIGVYFAMDHAIEALYGVLTGAGKSIASTGQSALGVHAICEALARLDATGGSDE